MDLKENLVNKAEFQRTNESRMNAVKEENNFKGKKKEDKTEIFSVFQLYRFVKYVKNPLNVTNSLIVSWDFLFSI